MAVIAIILAYGILSVDLYGVIRDKQSGTQGKAVGSRLFLCVYGFP